MAKREMTDQQKAGILGVLFVLLIGLVVFQVMSASSPAPAPAKAPAKAAPSTGSAAVATDAGTATETPAVETSEEAKAAQLFLTSSALPARDPFQIPGPIALRMKEAMNPDRGRPTQIVGNAGPGQAPRPLPGGDIPPFPVPGNVVGNSGNVVSNPGGVVATPTTGPAPVAGGSTPTPTPSVDVAPAYTLVGWVLGDAPVAVLKDSTGTERLVREGTQIDGDTRLVKIESGRVLVRRGGKNYWLKVGGNAE